MDQPLPPKKKHLGCWLVGILLGVLVLTMVGYFVHEFVVYYQAIQRGDLDPRLDRQLQSSVSVLQANAKVTPDDLKLINREDRPAMGSNKPLLTIVEFLDFGCPYCKESVPAVRQVVTDHADQVRLIIRDFPITDLHPQAMRTAIAARCAYKQGRYFPYHDLLYVNQDKQEDTDLLQYARDLSLDINAFTTCQQDPKTEQDIQQDLYDGLSAGVQGTPTFFFNGVKVQGALDQDALGYLVDEFMKKVVVK